MRLVIAVLVLAGTLLALGRARAASDPEIVVREVPRAWISSSAVPVFIDVRSRRGGRLKVTVEGDGSSVMRTVEVPANAPLRLEMTAYGASYLTVRYDGLGAAESNTFRVPAFRYDVDSGYDPMFACVNSFYLRELELAKGSATSMAEQEYAPINLDELPGRWQSYSGFAGVMVMDAREARSLRPEQREAMARWVRWLGGCVWLVGEGAANAAADIGLDLKGRTPQDEQGVLHYTVLNGHVFLQAAPDAEAIASRFPRLDRYNPIYQFYGGLNRNYRATPAGWYLERFGGVSTTLIIVILVLLGIVMGPVNYLYIRRRRNPLLFFVTTPVIALLGTVAIFGGSLFSEGLGGQYVQVAVLARAAGGEDAMLYDVRAVKSGFYAATPRFSADAEALPIRGGYDKVSVDTDVSDGLTLVSGWLKPRFPTGFIVSKPVFSRMNVEVVEENGLYYAVNGLGYAVETVAAKLPGGGYGWAGNLAPGARAELIRERSNKRLEGLIVDMQDPFGNGKVGDVGLVARCSGLPYLEDGGIGASRLEGRYFYCVVGEAGGRAGP